MSVGYARHFRELIVYKKAVNVSTAVFKLSQHFPAAERYSLTDQIRRSSRSVGAQIAEAWGKRRYPKHFTSKLTDADSEQYETQHWLEEGGRCGYLDTKSINNLLEELEAIHRMLNSMIDKSDQFCFSQKNMIKEAPAEYFISIGNNQKDRLYRKLNT